MRIYILKKIIDPNSINLAESSASPAAPLIRSILPSIMEDLEVSVDDVDSDDSDLLRRAVQASLNMRRDRRSAVPAVNITSIIEDRGDSSDDVDSDDSDLLNKAVQASLKLQAERRPAGRPADDYSEVDDEDSDDFDLAGKASMAYLQSQASLQPMGQAEDPSPSHIDSSPSEVEVVNHSSTDSEDDSDADLASRAAYLYHTAIADAAASQAAEPSPSQTVMDVDMEGFSLKIPIGEYTAEHFASVPDEWIM